MKKFVPIYLYGALTLFAGVFLIYSKHSSFNAIRLMLGITLSVGAVLAFMAAFSRRRKQVQFAYHELHAFTMLVYGVSILLLGNTIEKVISFTSFLLFFYAFSEIIFCNWLFNLDKKIVVRTLITRLILGVVTGIGTVVGIYKSYFTLEIYGAIFILIGINIMLYVPIMREHSVNEGANDPRIEQ
jgi:uncharacterized membrane protein HdeD (DUF308 family)